VKKSLLNFFKFVKTKITLNWITFGLLVQKLWNDKCVPCLMEGFLVVPKVELGYLRVWGGHCQWLLWWSKKKIKCNIGLFGVFFIFPYFQGKLLRVAMFRYYIHKSYQYKIRFWKKIYNPSRIEIFILGDFQNVRGFLFWVGPIIMAQSKKKNLNLTSIPSAHPIPIPT